MIYVIGIGPGNYDYLAPEAFKALGLCEAVYGYERYIDLIRDLVPGKILVPYKMTQELKRCNDAVNFALETGKNIALISSGDSGVYGMAGLMLETASGTGLEVRIIPGITAANSAAAVLGAPLMNDYVILSLSDYMTDWEIIEKRIIAASEGDFVICIYNPASNHRPDNFRRACDIMLKYKKPDTVCGYVRNIGREGEEYEIMTLKEIRESEKIDMLCTVIIGSSQSYILDGKMITRRGYNLS